MVKFTNPVTHIDGEVGDPFKLNVQNVLANKRDVAAKADAVLGTAPVLKAGVKLGL